MESSVASWIRLFSAALVVSIVVNAVNHYSLPVMDYVKGRLRFGDGLERWRV